MRSLLRRGRIWLVASTMGGSVLVLEGCDPTARDTVLGGVEDSASTLATTFIQAFFETLSAPGDDDDAPDTVKVFVDSALLPTA
jgi:hypothetical protein